MKKKFACQDKYEAMKLSSLIFIKQFNNTFITEILDVIDNEIVILLKDGSAHSIILENKFQVEMFVDFVQSVIEHKHRIVDIKVFTNYVEISKE